MLRETIVGENEMNLKRETDYSIRIIYCLLQGEESEKLNTNKICKKTNIPWRIVERVCDTLYNGGIISRDFGKDKKCVYYLTEKNREKSLFDIVLAIESQADIFAVFDKNSEMFRHCGKYLQKNSRKMEDCLKEMTIDKMLSWKTDV